MRISLDLDDVIRDFVPEIIRTYNKTFNTQITINEVISWDISAYLPKLNDLYSFLEAYPETFTKMKPIPGASSTIRRLHKGEHQINILTNQYKGLEHLACNWLNANKIYYDSITFSRDKTIVRSELFVDDRPLNFIEYCKAYPEATVLLMDKPWNSEVITNNRIYSLPEIYNYI